MRGVGEAYTYTASNRLQQGGSTWGTLVWTYDGVGNRTAVALTSGATTTNTYNYPSGNNPLASLTQSSTTVRSFSYDRRQCHRRHPRQHHLQLYLQQAEPAGRARYRLDGHR